MAFLTRFLKGLDPFLLLLIAVMIVASLLFLFARETRGRRAVAPASVEAR